MRDDREGCTLSNLRISPFLQQGSSIRPARCFGLAPGVCSGSIIQFVTMANCTLSRAVGDGIFFPTLIYMARKSLPVNFFLNS